MKLGIVISSVRVGRAGSAVGDWFRERVCSHAGFESVIVDLQEWNLPAFSEPQHPRLKKYQFEHTKRWSAAVDALDAFALVVPEYNHGAPPALLNALDYLVDEWAYKPAVFVSYGGVSAGTRAVSMLTLTLNSLKIVPIYEAVSIPFVSSALVDGTYPGSEIQNQAASLALSELLRWAVALKTLRV
ncbi:MAG: NAD(P)H-dependent oxidoreductase [Kofleriaceae bacterium]